MNRAQALHTSSRRVYFCKCCWVVSALSRLCGAQGPASCGGGRSDAHGRIGAAQYPVRWPEYSGICQFPSARTGSLFHETRRSASQHLHRHRHRLFRRIQVRAQRVLKTRSQCHGGLAFLFLGRARPRQLAELVAVILYMLSGCSVAK